MLSLASYHSNPTDIRSSERCRWMPCGLAAACVSADVHGLSIPALHGAPVHSRGSSGGTVCGILFAGVRRVSHRHHSRLVWVSGPHSVWPLLSFEKYRLSDRSASPARHGGT